MQEMLFQRPEFLKFPSGAWLCGPSKPVIQNAGSAPEGGKLFCEFYIR
jgi:hypothetical protein